MHVFCKKWGVTIVRLSRYLLISVVAIFSLTLFAQGIFAESTGTSNATVNFIEDTSVPGVLDPENPTDPFDPGDGDNDPTGNFGPLSLDYVSHLAFGEQIVSLEDETYEAKTLHPFIQVTDRRSNPTGWSVTVKATPFADAGNTNLLAGATIQFSNGETLSDLGAMYVAPTTTDFTLTTDNQSKNVVSANSNEGRGSWITRWFPTSPTTTNDSVKLSVPGGIMKATSYTSTLTWTLSDTP